MYFEIILDKKSEFFMISAKKGENLPFCAETRHFSNWLKLVSTKFTVMVEIIKLR